MAIVTSPADNQAIERFVRGTLGCGCPDEVFNSIVVERTAGPGTSAPHVRLLVGNRLLIYVIGAGDVEQARAAVSVLAPRGRGERDSMGLNRFRLVVAASLPTPPMATAASAVFADVAGHDERAHLHVIAADLVPATLR